MKKTVLAIISGMLALSLGAQQPVAIKNNLPPVGDDNAFIISGYNAALMDIEDNAPRNGITPPLRVGRLIDANLSLHNSGEWAAVPGGRLWRLKIRMEGAEGVSVLGKVHSFPAGASLSIYSPDGKEIVNYYKAADFSTRKIISTETVAGPEAILEYFEPDGQTGKGSFVIEKIGYLYRNTSNYNNSIDDFGQSSGCHVNVNCPEGGRWQHQKKSVVRIKAYTDAIIQWCTGTLMNTTTENFKPYVLTAMHCALSTDDSTLSNDTMFNYWLFTFNYESPTCANPPSEGNLADKTITGAQVRAHSNDKGGEYGSDFLLVELSQPVPIAYNAYYAGWSLDTTNNWGPTDSAVSIHHPRYDIKKISTYTWPLKPGIPYPGTSPDVTHWEVFWSQTANGHGVTEGGSSGAPIFDQNGYLVGTLTGGNSSCVNNTRTDFYGRIDWHWNRNADSVHRSLKPWLDSAGIGGMRVNGAYQYPVSANEVKKNTLTIYPNPAADWLYFSSNTGSNGAVLVTIHNLLGRELMSCETEGSVQVAALAAGMYFITVKQNNTVYTARFIKE